MHVPPPSIASIELKQKLSDEASGPGNVQHDGFAISVQSVFALQRRICCMPEHDRPTIVGQLASALHDVVTLPLWQLGGLPPSSGISPQHT